MAIRDRPEPRPRLRVLCEQAGILTPRQCDVLEMLTRGLVLKQVAYELGISEGTARNHLNAARRRAGAKTTLELVARLLWPVDDAA